MNNNTTHVVDAIGFPFCSIYQLSKTLRALNVSHSVVSGKYGLPKPKLVYNLGYEQPVWVTIVDGLKSARHHLLVKKKRQILLIVDSESLLKFSNCRIAPSCDRLEDSVVDALLGASVDRKDPFVVKIEEPSMDDFVHMATKPSFLNHIQTAVYKISNYPVRKEIQKQIIKSLYGTSSIRASLQVLGSSLKYESLLCLMQDPQAVKLREAVQEFRPILAKDNKADPEVIAKRYGFESFEIMYVVRSYEKMVRDEALAKRHDLPKRGRKPSKTSKKR